MFEIFNQVEDAATTSTSTLDTLSSKSNSRVDMTSLELTPQSVAHLIKNDFPRWQELLCANKSSSLYRSPQEVALVSIDAIVGHCLPRVDLQTQSSKSELLHSYLSESLYVLEQPFLEQVKYLASATRSGAAGGQMPTVRILEAFQKVDILQLVMAPQTTQEIQLAWLRSLIIVFNNEISLIMRSNGANLQVNQDYTQLAHAIVTCRNIKCLLIQLLIEVLCLC
mmetsp:Transcript_37052/g.48693  ORF Transcript_37052/g.48693 Transcript_37052/m.48693 type:complete len:224 (-) Transcript_37052:977-1648(-)